MSNNAVHVIIYKPWLSANQDVVSVLETATEVLDTDMGIRIESVLTISNFSVRQIADYTCKVTQDTIGVLETIYTYSVSFTGNMSLFFA